MSSIHSKNTTILISHGAWHAHWHYDPLIAPLRSAGYTVECPQLPSVGSTDTTFDNDVAILRKHIDSITSSGKDVAVVCHSYGGICAGEAVKGLLKGKDGNEHGVVKIVYLCAFAVPGGKSLMDLLGNQPLPWWTASADGKAWDTKDEDKIFYNDIEDKETREKFMKGLKQQPKGTKESRSTWEPYREVSAAYIVCEKDMAIPAQAQEGMAKGAGIKEIARVDASHTPWVAKQEETAKAVLDAIEGRLA